MRTKLLPACYHGPIAETVRGQDQILKGGPKSDELILDGNFGVPSNWVEEDDQ